MNKFLTLFSILIFCWFSVSAQTGKNADWKIFAPGNEEFSVSLPGSPEIFNYDEKDENSEILYRLVSEGTYFLISGGNDIKSFDYYNSIKLLAKENKAKAENKTIGNFHGEKLSFTDSENFHQTILIIEGKNRFYIFHTVSEVENNLSVERFFSSLKFDKTSPAIGTTSKKESKITENQNPTDTKTNKFPTGGGIGISGSGTGNGNTISSDSPTAPKIGGQTSRLKILSKPKPPYTDLARYYWIAGEVRLRVTFKADGTIGTVSPVTRLPFGLTANAIAAARAMSFEPAMRDGIQHAVASTVIYSFMIY